MQSTTGIHSSIQLLSASFQIKLTTIMSFKCHRLCLFRPTFRPCFSIMYDPITHNQQIYCIALHMSNPSQLVLPHFIQEATANSLYMHSFLILSLSICYSPISTFSFQLELRDCCIIIQIFLFIKHCWSYSHLKEFPFDFKGILRSHNTLEVHLLFNHPSLILSITPSDLSIMENF